METPPVAAFLSQMWGNGPHVIGWQAPGQRFGYNFIDSPDEVTGHLSEMQSFDVWIGAHPLKGRPADGRGSRDDVAEVASLQADLDWEHPSRKTTQPLPSEAELRERLARMEVQPTTVVHSGHGLQAWWALYAPVAPDVGEELIARLNAALDKVGLVNGRPDLASIMRLPGTRNHKDPANPIPAVVERASTGRYLPEYLRKRWPDQITTTVGAGGTRHRSGSVTDAQQALHDYVVEHYGGHGTYVASDGSMHLTRPGKSAKEGSSASIITGEQGDALLTVFSPHWNLLGPENGEPYRVWRLDGDELVTAHFDPLDGVTITATTPTSSEHETPTTPPPADSLLVWEEIPDPFVLPTMTWHAEALLSRPTHGEIAGGEKSLKSYLSLAIAVGLAAGLPVLGKFDVPERQRVLMLVGEGGRGPWLRRLAGVCANYGVEPGDLRPWLHFTTRTASVSAPRFIDELRAKLGDFGPSLVMLDPWYAYASGQADSRQVTEVGQSLATFGSTCLEFGASAIVNHHFNRNSEAPGLRQITGAGHAEWVDSWMLMRHRQPAQPATGAYRLRMDVGSRQWGGDTYDVDFDITPLTLAVTWRCDVAGDRTDGEAGDPLTAVKLELLRVGRRARVPLTRAAWVARVKRRRGDALAAFDEMVEQGQIIVAGTVKAGNRDVATYEVAEADDES